MMEWLAMGGYGFYVWASFALTFAVLALNLVLARARHQRIMNSLKASHADESAERPGGFREVTS
ncbi:MAG: heme exporter protein CcmD [Pseudomonadota bacterium]